MAEGIKYFHTYRDNATYVAALDVARECVLVLCEHGAKVTRLQIKKTGPVFEIASGENLLKRLPLTATPAEKNGTCYQQTELLGCPVVWKQK